MPWLIQNKIVIMGNVVNTQMSSIGMTILTKFGFVLTKTKEALLIDLKKQLPQDIENPDDLFSYIDDLFEQLGYEAHGLIPDGIKSTANKSFELAENIDQVLKRITPASEFLQSLNWEDVKNYQPEDDSNEDADAPDVLLELADSMVKMVTNIIEIVTIIKDSFESTFSENEEAWNKLINNSNLEKELPKRILDHTITVFLENIFVVFKEDIVKIIDEIEQKIIDFSNQHLRPLLEHLMFLFQEFKALVTQGIATLEDKLTESIQKIHAEVKKIIFEIQKNVSDTANEELKEAITTLKKYLEALNYFKQAEAVLIFLNFTTKERICVFKAKVNEADYQDINSLINLTTEIHVIHWNRVEKLFKNPVNYFNEIYPVENFEQATVLMDQLSKLAKAFGYNIPDVSSMKSFLIELLQRIGYELEKQTQSTAQQIRSFIESLDTLIRSLLTFIEGTVLELKNNIETHIESVLHDITSEVSEAFKFLRNESNEINNDLKKIIEDLPRPILRNDAPFIKNILDEVLLPVIHEKAKQFDTFKKLSMQNWEQLLNEISIEYVDQLTALRNDINEFTERDWLTSKYDSMVLGITAEFNKQTSSLPSNYEALFERFESPQSLHPKEMFSEIDPFAFVNIISEEIKKGVEIFDLNRYFSNFINVSVSAFDKIHNQTTQSSLDFKNNLPSLDDLEKLKKNFISFLNAILIDAWKKIKAALIDVYLIPYLKLFEAIIYQKGTEVIRQIVELVKNIKLPGATQTFWEQLKAAVPSELQTLANTLYPIIEEATKANITDWKDGVKLSLRIVQALYNAYSENEEFKDVIDQILPIPNMKWLDDSESIKDAPSNQPENTNSNKIDIKIPDYSFDVKNNFLSITLLDKKKNNAQGLIRICLFIGKKEIEIQNETKDVYGVFIIPVLQGNWNESYEVGIRHLFTLNLSASVNNLNLEKTDELIDALKQGSVGAFLSHKKCAWLDNTDQLETAASLIFQRKESNKALSVLKSKYLDFTIENYPQKIVLGYKDKAFYWNYTGEIQNGTLVLKIREINSFFEQVLKEDLTANFDTKLIWDSTEGLKFDGNVGLKTNFNINKKIADVFTLHKLGIEIAKAPKDDSTLKVFITSDFTIDINVISFTVSDLGLGFEINYLKEDGSIGDFDLSPSFSFPSGFGISIDAKAIKGTGVINYNKEKEEFIGALSLSLLDKIELKALALLTLKMPDGSKGFSFVGLISVTFVPGIPIGMGFSLTGVGGALGLNRNISTDAMMQGVRSGEIGTVLFIENLDENKELVINNLGVYFPVQERQFFFGIIARISYADFLNIDFGLLITAPNPTAVFIAGGLHVILPDKKAPLVELHAYFLGQLNLSEHFLSFDASIVNSKIVGLDIYGDIALRIGWGSKNKGFLFSAGGFHPLYKPEEGLNIQQMSRLGMKLDYSLLKLKMESYFAITSNTVQFGAHADLHIGWKSAKLTGYLYFDSLFQFQPFSFIVELSTGVKVKVFGKTLMSVQLSFALSGPAKWNARGKAKFKVLFVSFTVDFNVTWGQAPQESKYININIYEILTQEYYKVENWKVLSSGDQNLGVYLLEIEENIDEVVIQPFDSLQFEQARIPLNTLIQRIGETGIPDKNTKIRIVKMGLGTDSETHEIDFKSTQYSFAPSLFFNLSEDEKLALPSFESMDNGMIIENELTDRETNDFAETTISYEVNQDDISFENIDSSAINGFKLNNKKLIYRIQNNEVGSLVSELVEIDIKQITSAVSRRTDAGFKNYVRKEQNKQQRLNREKFNLFSNINKQSEFKLNEVSTIVHEKDGKLRSEIIGGKKNISEIIEQRQMLLKNNPNLRKKLRIKTN